MSVKKYLLDQFIGAKDVTWGIMENREVILLQGLLLWALAAVTLPEMKGANRTNSCGF